MVSRIGMWWEKITQPWRIAVGAILLTFIVVMVSRIGMWWEKITQPWRIAVGAILLTFIVVIILGYRLNWHWTGLVPETSEPKQHWKTLWDWLQLIFVPLALALGGFWLSQVQKTTEQRITTDNQREIALQAYIDKMSELLLQEKGLRDSNPEDEIRKVARVRTLTVLPRLDAKRKRSVVQFLLESGLIDKDKCIIKLYGADLSCADFSGADLRRANLIEANLNYANFSGSYLRYADLGHANLTGANLSDANLRDANLSRANLTGANLSRAILNDATLNYVNLSGADLCEADLNYANFSGSYLLHTNFSRADLTGANLINVNLSNARITEGQLSEAKSLQGATMSDGSRHP